MADKKVEEKSEEVKKLDHQTAKSKLQSYLQNTLAFI